MDKTEHDQICAALDALCHKARIHWDEATKEAKKLEQEIHALEEQLERA